MPEQGISKQEDDVPDNSSEILLALAAMAERGELGNRDYSGRKDNLTQLYIQAGATASRATLQSAEVA